MKEYKKWIVATLGMLVAMLWVYGDKVYTIAIVPQTSAAKIQQRWQPVLDEIKEETGITLELVYNKTIPSFEEYVVKGTPDFAYMNPYHAYRAYELQKYVPFIRDKDKLLFGQLWVHANSSIKTVKDLNGKRIAFPAPNAFGASLYMRALLANKEGIQFDSKYVKTHSNVYRHVAMRKTAAGGGVARTYKAEPKGLQKAIRLLYQTPGVRPHPICAHPRVPVEVRDLITAAIISIGMDDDGKKKLKAIAIPDPVEANYEKDYAPLAELKLADFSEGAMR